MLATKRTEALHKEPHREDKEQEAQTVACRTTGRSFVLIYVLGFCLLVCFLSEDHLKNLSENFLIF